MMTSLKQLTFLFLLFTTFSFGQNDDDPGGFGETDPSQEPTPVTIDSITLPLIITGVLTAVYFIRRKQKEVLQ